LPVVRTRPKSSVYLAVGLVTVGFFLIYLAWNGASEKDFVQGQFPYLLSGGLPGIGLILCGLTLAATQGQRRDLLALQDRLDELIAQLGSRAPAATSPAMLTAVPDDTDVFVTTGTTYHRPSCRTVQGRSGLELVAVDDVEGRGLSACRVCSPAA
jgi:hypothetical protein